MEISELKFNEKNPAINLCCQVFSDQAGYFNFFKNRKIREKAIKILYTVAITMGLKYGKVIALREEKTITAIAVFYIYSKKITLLQEIKSGALRFLTIGFRDTLKVLEMQEIKRKIHSIHAAYRHLYLEVFVVRIDKQRKGYGSKLLSYIKKNELDIYLEAMNNKSIQFYSKNGFNSVYTALHKNRDFEAAMIWNNAK